MTGVVGRLVATDVEMGDGDGVEILPGEAHADRAASKMQAASVNTPNSNLASGVSPFDATSQRGHPC